MAACKMISFNKQHKIFPYRKYFICVVFVFFIKLFRGGGGGVLSLSIIAWERCIKFSEFVCALV